MSTGWFWVHTHLAQISRDRRAVADGAELREVPGPLSGFKRYPSRRCLLRSFTVKGSFPIVAGVAGDSCGNRQAYQTSMATICSIALSLQCVNARLGRHSR